MGGMATAVKALSLLGEILTIDRIHYDKDDKELKLVLVDFGVQIGFTVDQIDFVLDSLHPEVAHQLKEGLDQTEHTWEVKQNALEVQDERGHLVGESMAPFPTVLTIPAIDRIDEFSGGLADAQAPGVANWNPSPHYFGRYGYRPEAIVIHIAQGSFEAIGSWFKNPVSRVSSHYGIGRDGRIDQYVDETHAAWHAGRIDRPSWSLLKANVNPNLYTIGIEHEGYAHEPWTDVMYQTSAQLVKEIATRYGIPLDRNHIIGHRQIDGGRSCPGSEVDLMKLIDLAKNGTAVLPTASTYYTVQRGDTLYGIGRRFSLSIQELRALNPDIANINFIQVGQRIRVS